MRVSYRWLLHELGYDIALGALLERMTMNGLEIESVTDLGVGSGRVVVGKILEIKQHPNADNLVLCQVDTHGAAPLRIVCGAKNMKAGDMVPVALDGAHLPNGMTLKRSKIRGEVSEGMMCSPKELGLNDDASGLLLLPQDWIYQIGASFDAIIDVKVTPNRADCLSIRGIARDVAAADNRPIAKFPAHDVAESAQSACEFARVRNEAPGNCPRYMGRVIRGVTIAPSPLWLQRAIETAGLRAINNVVDVTNDILIELGHPLHAFDLDRIAGSEVVIRNARDGEQVETLDGQSCVLTTDDLLIADPEKPIALAGIMGCGNTEITENTRNVFLECAYFTPATIRRTSKRLGKSTDSSYRFERGTDWMALPMIIDRAARLIAETAGGEICAGAFDEGTQMSLPEPILLETARVNMLIGCELNDAQIAEPLRALGFEVMPAGAGATNVRAPSFRADVQCDADLVEEIARIRGYNLIPCELPRIQTRANYPDDDNVLTRKLRERLVSEGFTEVSNYSFTSQDSLARCGFDAATAPRLNNPLSAEYAVMRTHLLPGLLESVLYNQNRGTPDVKLFEIGKVYALAAGKDAPDGDSPVSEQWQFAAVISGPCVESTWRIPAQMGDFHAGKAVAESIVRALGASGAESVRPADAQKDMDENWLGALHPGKSAALVMDGRVLLITGELHPRVRARLELKRNVTALFANFAALAPLLARKPKFGDIPLFPVVSRDLAFVAELDTPAAEIENVITKRTKSLLWDIKLFDVYEGEKIPAGKKSLAYSLQFNARDRTLTDDEVNQLQDKILADLKTKLGVELRQ